MIIITAPVHDFFIETLTQKGLEYIYAPKLSYSELYDKIDAATGIIVSTNIKIDRPLLDKAVGLKWIGRIGSGMDHIDVEYAKSKNIICESSPEGNKNAVAEFAVGLLLNLMRNTYKSANEVRNHQWLRNENRGPELTGKVIGIIGYGNTGSAFAKLLSSFDVSILAYDKYKSGFGNDVVEESNLEKIFKYADVISFHLPLTIETKHFANHDFFKQLQRQPILLNTSRGSVINTSSLIAALKNGIIKAAALDVLENEQLSSYNSEEKKEFEFLINQNNVIITPHIAGYSFESTYKMSRILLEKLGII
jgi:D-3-phosphoglycerate dehydrogenase